MCSVGSNFNLSIGAVANAMSQAAGPTLQKALREKKDEIAVLGEGDIIHTVPGNLCWGRHRNFDALIGLLICL